jgi:uncharacterized protein YhfF
MTVEEYWREYKSKSGDKADTYKAYCFCSNEQDARELACLVIRGKKRATASNAWVYEHEGEPLPKIGDMSVITDFYGEPKCVIKTTGADIVRFSSVTAEFAAAEGEGDLSLEFWRDAHRRVFTRECESIGRVFSEDMPVVCERFTVVYK